MSAPLKIGQVHTRLRERFPTLELSKIRYYEEMGLVAPARSKKGYRLYSERDIECLEEAIRLADEEFVPLRVVRLRLIDRGLLVDPGPRVTQTRAARSAATSAVTIPVPPRAPLVAVEANEANEANNEESREETSTRLSLLSLASHRGVEPEVVNRLVSLGAIVPRIIDGETSVETGDVRIALAASALYRAGADLRVVTSVRRLVDRELGVVVESAGDLRHRVGPEEARRAMVQLAREISSLREALYERELEHLLEGD
ncbi:MAG: MerR family transcriptional regulator [Acidimicrobiaceae bacterium]|nr:MerR family transcriptional regulator [Acidimicrobiaceae bacterium]